LFAFGSSAGPTGAIFSRDAPPLAEHKQLTKVDDWRGNAQGRYPDPSGRVRLVAYNKQPAH
jgi:hypothetical protein